MRDGERQVNLFWRVLAVATLLGVASWDRTSAAELQARVVSVSNASISATGMVQTLIAVSERIRAAGITSPECQVLLDLSLPRVCHYPLGRDEGTPPVHVVNRFVEHAAQYQLRRFQELATNRVCFEACNLPVARLVKLSGALLGLTQEATPEGFVFRLLPKEVQVIPLRMADERKVCELGQDLRLEEYEGLGLIITNGSMVYVVCDEMAAPLVNASRETESRLDKRHINSLTNRTGRAASE